jgi:hypothetical protein
MSVPKNTSGILSPTYGCGALADDPRVAPAAMSAVRSIDTAFKGVIRRCFF